MHRRYSRLAAVAVAVAAFTTCSGIDNIDVDAEGQAVIPAGTVVDQLLGNVSFLGLDGFDISQSQEFRNQGYSKDQIDSVVVKHFTLSIDGPAGANFDFIDSIHFFAESEGLPRVEIASLDPVPTGSNELELDLASVELRDYAAAASMTITTEASGRRPPDETTVSAHVVLDVDVAVSGACK